MSDSIEKETLESLAAQMGGGDALTRVIAMYTSKLPGEIEALRTAFMAGDLGTVQSSAHRLKSSSGQLGAVRLATMLAELEAAGRDGDADQAGRLLARVESEAGHVQRELESFSL